MIYCNYCIFRFGCGGREKGLTWCANYRDKPAILFHDKFNNQPRIDINFSKIRKEQDK